MISPLEIQEKEFSRGLKGFKEDEVNEFLDQITLDLEHLLEENRQLKAEKQQMEETYSIPAAFAAYTEYFKHRY